MKNILKICNLALEDLPLASKVFEESIPDAFEKEGLHSLEDVIQEEINHKTSMLKKSLEIPNSDTFFLIAKIENTVVGTISFGPCGKEIIDYIDSKYHDIGELGSLYVLPIYQNQGVGSILIKALIERLYEQGVDSFFLDSGYKRAQLRWIRKFGKPFKILKNYWGSGSDHMIWLCQVNDFVHNNC